MAGKTETEGETAVDAYLAEVPETFRAILAHLRTIIREAAPDATEAIGYGIPTFKLDGNLVHFAAFRNHMSFFPGSTAHNEALKDDLKGYKLAKGTIQFTPDKPLPDDLVRRIVRLRIAENRAISAARKSAKRKK
jgi:uncharacterized protein YdhG (YjbR/CyaY superfamily)